VIQETWGKRFPSLRNRVLHVKTTQLGLSYKNAQWKLGYRKEAVTGCPSKEAMERRLWKGGCGKEAVERRLWKAADSIYCGKLEIEKWRKVE
jgi:hypothetical protein